MAFQERFLNCHINEAVEQMLLVREGDFIGRIMGSGLKLAEMLNLRALRAAQNLAID